MTRKQVFLVVLLPGCDPGPCLELEAGDRLGVTITSPTTPCTDELDLQQDRQVVARLQDPTDNEHTNCQYWHAKFERVGRWTWTKRTTVGFQGTVGGDYELLRDDGCTGVMTANVATKLPPAVGRFDIRFQGNAAPAPCPTSCVADLDAEIEKL